LPGERLMLLPLDVTVQEEREAAIRAVERRWGGIDVLVNNAGISYRAVAEHVTEAERIAQLDSNSWPMELISWSCRICASSAMGASSTSRPLAA